MTLADLTNTNNNNGGTFDNSKKTKAYFDKVFGTNLDFEFNEETQELTLLSPYRNLKVKEYSIKEQSNGKVIVVGLGNDDSEYAIVQKRFTDPESDSIAQGVKQAIAISILQFLEATLNRSLTLEEKQKIGGNNVEEWLESIKALAGSHPVNALVEFYRETGSSAQFSLVERTKNISAKEDMDSTLVLKKTMTVIPKGGTTVAVPSTPTITTAVDSLPF